MWARCTAVQRGDVGQVWCSVVWCAAWCGVVWYGGVEEERKEKKKEEDHQK